ncbi:MAG TPA: hypothetical protein VLD59_13440 [Steroidobacteraceae bacterium]|nr:hypothetical protein [Steroidobacteraceae bacterium]
MNVITRRGLIQVGAALAASGIAVRKAGAFGRLRSVEFRAMFVEAGSSDGVAFGRAVAARGIDVQLVGIDLHKAHFNLRQHADDHEPAAIGGLTSAATLFTLEPLVWHARLRLVFLGRHAIVRGEPMHALKGHRAAISRFHSSVRWIDWRIAIANTLTEVPYLAPALQPVSDVRNAVIEGDTALFSWVIAPVPHRRKVFA